MIKQARMSQRKWQRKRLIGRVVILLFESKHVRDILWTTYAPPEDLICPTITTPPKKNKEWQLYRFTKLSEQFKGGQYVFLCH